MINGTFWPAYVLCKSFTTSKKRSGYRICNIVEGIQKSKLPRVLFTEMTGHEDMINFMSSYQVVIKKKHYHPRGWLCWYGCNQYGDPNGFIRPIKKVPEFIWFFNYSLKGFQKLKKDREFKEVKLNELLSREPLGIDYEESNKKVRLNQKSIRELRRIKDASKERRSNRED